jgi:aspartate carbamoyltransferase catalytic subunit
MDLKNQDILDGAQFTREQIDFIIKEAKGMKESLRKTKQLNIMNGYILATLFFEPSTRTRLSFETAMHRLGGDVIGFASAGTTSEKKGESLADTVRTVEQYADLIAIRHPMIGSAKVAAEAVNIPVLNGGDGAGQHPTQALLDLFTIGEEKGSIDGLTIALCGDLKFGRTVHAGVELFKHYDCRLIFISPEELRLPEETIGHLNDRGVGFEETTDLEGAIADADVLYMTRIQKERFETPQDYERLKDLYILSREMILKLNPDLTVLHPLPRVNEITPDVDQLSGAAYFRQVKNGVYIRMALIALVMGMV